jgi:hypothetical protein
MRLSCVPCGVAATLARRGPRRQAKGARRAILTAGRERKQAEGWHMAYQPPACFSGYFNAA